MDHHLNQPPGLCCPQEEERLLFWWVWEKELSHVVQPLLFSLFLEWQPTHWQDSSSVSLWGKLQVQVQLGKLVSSKQAWVGKFIS